MTKQEEIRGWIAKQAEYIKFSMMETNWHADQILPYLHSQGVVLKVDKELPENPHFSGEDTSDYGLGLQNGFDQALRKMAGYVAVEPLIKE